MPKTEFIIRGARPIFDELAEIDRLLDANRRERNRLLEHKRAVTDKLGTCAIEFPDRTRAEDAHDPA